MKINISVEVPDNWKDRFDMQPYIEAEIKADRWSWNYIKSENSAPIEEVRLWFARGKYTLLDIIHVQNINGGLYIHCKKPNTINALSEEVKNDS